MTDLQPPTVVGRIGKMAVRNGRYVDAESNYQRVSTLLKNIETDTFHLDEWKGNMQAIGLSMRPDLVLGVAAAAQFDPATGKLTKDAKSALKDLRKQATDAAKSKAGANQGNALHTATERLDLGESAASIALPYPFNADLAAYETLKRVAGLRFRPEHVERTVRIKSLYAAGTYDRIGECDHLVDLGILAPGELIVVDVKTESDPLLNLIHICPQLACYANADDVFVPAPTSEDQAAGTYEPMPNVSKTVGLVVHVRNGRAVPYVVNLAAGWRSAQRAAEQRDDLKASKIALGEPGCWAGAVPINLPPAADLVASAHERGPMGYSAPAGTTQGGYQAEATAVADDIEALRRQLIEAIWQTLDVGGLSDLYEKATAHGIRWDGAVAMAGTARMRIVQCPHREMHDPSTTVKCACGWERGTLK